MTHQDDPVEAALKFIASKSDDDILDMQEFMKHWPDSDGDQRLVTAMLAGQSAMSVGKLQRDVKRLKVATIVLSGAVVFLLGYEFGLKDLSVVMGFVGGVITWLGVKP